MSQPAPQPDRARQGLALVELIIATTLGAMLLVAVAEVARMFGNRADVLHDESDWRLQECIDRLTEDLQRAWFVESPDGTTLCLTDADGHKTTVALVGSELRVTRPTGASGALLSDVSAFHVQTERVRRLRDGASLRTAREWWALRARGGPAHAVHVEQGAPIALGFVLSQQPPDWVHAVDDVQEQTLRASLDQLLMPMAHVPGPEVLRRARREAAEPPTNPKSRRQRSAADAPSTKFVLTLHETLATDDARPLGPALAHLEWPLHSLPLGRLPTTAAGDRVASAATNFAPPTMIVPIDLSPMGRAMQPGRSHTLVLSLNGPGTLLLSGIRRESTTHTGVARRSEEDGPYRAAALSIPRTLLGICDVTQTEVHDVVLDVQLSLKVADGRSASIRATVVSQASVEDPWGGAAPGELPDVSFPERRGQP